MLIIKVTLLLILIGKIECLSCDHRENEKNKEKKLKNDLFCNYDLHIRPGDSDKSTDISMRLNVKSFDYEETGNKMVINAWMTLSWQDNRLVWSPSNYSGITSIHMKSDLLWSPNLKVYNTHIPSESSCEVIDCLISNTSRVACVMPCTHTAHCKDTGVENWPYDTQTCTFTFGSWMKPGEHLNYIEKRIVLVVNKANQNGQWKMVANSSSYDKGVYASLNDTFPTVKFTFKLERHNGFHHATSISSGIILMLTNLMVLCLAPGSLTRIFLCGANLFSNTLFLSFLFYMIPYGGDTCPKVFTFFTDLQIIATILIIESVIVKNILANQEKASLWMQNSTLKFKKSNLGQILVNETFESEPEDVDQLIENLNQSADDASVRMRFCVIIDRVVLIALMITFSFMIFALFPSNYS